MLFPWLPVLSLFGVYWFVAVVLDVAVKLTGLVLATLLVSVVLERPVGFVQLTEADSERGWRSLSVY